MQRVARPRPARALRPTLALLLTAILATPLLADEFPGIRALMSAEEFRAAGLENLSDSELKALNGWLINYTAGDAQVLQENNETVREAKKNFVIESRLMDGFTGWSGDTVFRLENGQVWYQRLEGRYPYRGPPNPEVRIDRNWLGFYRLTVVETGRSVGVRTTPQ